MKISRLVVSLTACLALQATAHASQSILTAHVGADGTVLRQWPKWIEKVEHKPQPNYYSEYKLAFNPRIVHADPGYCSVSPIDGSDYQRLVHGHAKVVGKPLANQATVITQLVDLKGPSGDNSMEFLVMCIR